MDDVTFGTDDRLRKTPLTQREVAVLAGIAHGRMNTQIAAQLHISESTVKTHIRRIMFKLDALNRAHAVTIGFVRGYLTVPTRTGGA